VERLKVGAINNYDLDFFEKVITLGEAHSAGGPTASAGGPTAHRLNKRK
jgi:hypothetical protein